MNKPEQECAHITPKALGPSEGVRLSGYPIEISASEVQPKRTTLSSAEVPHFISTYPPSLPTFPGLYTIDN